VCVCSVNTFGSLQWQLMHAVAAATSSVLSTQSCCCSPASCEAARLGRKIRAVGRHPSCLMHMYDSEWASHYVEVVSSIICHIQHTWDRSLVQGSIGMASECACRVESQAFVPWRDFKGFDRVISSPEESLQGLSTPAALPPSLRSGPSLYEASSCTVHHGAHLQPPDSAPRVPSLRCE